MKGGGKEEGGKKKEGSGRKERRRKERRRKGGEGEEGLSRGRRRRSRWQRGAPSESPGGGDPAPVAPRPRRTQVRAPVRGDAPRRVTPAGPSLLYLHQLFPVRQVV